MFAFTKQGQKGHVTLSAIDGKGRPTAIPEGEITVTNSNEISLGSFFDQAAKQGDITALEEPGGSITYTLAGLTPAVVEATVSLTAAVALVATEGPITDPA